MNKYCKISLYFITVNLRSAHSLCYSPVDFNECNVYGTCSQTCANTEGSYTCSCVEGYLLQPDNRSCKAKNGENTHTKSATETQDAVHLSSHSHICMVWHPHLFYKRVYWRNMYYRDAINAWPVTSLHLLLISFMPTFPHSVLFLCLPFPSPPLHTLDHAPQSRWIVCLCCWLLTSMTSAAPPWAAPRPGCPPSPPSRPWLWTSSTQRRPSAG